MLNNILNACECAYYLDRNAINYIVRFAFLFKNHIFKHPEEGRNIITSHTSIAE